MADSADTDYQRVAIACQRLRAEGAYPGVRSVQRILKEHLGGGIKTERIGALIRRWELESPCAEKPVKPPEPSLSLEEMLETHADLRPAIEALAAALVSILEARAWRDTDERVRAVQSAIELAREEAAQRQREMEDAHARALAERETVVAGLRAQEAALVEEIERLEATLAERTAAIEALRLALALARDEARQAMERAEKLAAALAVAEESGKTASRLEADLAASRQSLAVVEETRSQMAALVEGLRADLKAERDNSEALHARIERLVGDLAAAIARTPDIPRAEIAGHAEHGNGGDRTS